MLVCESIKMKSCPQCRSQYSDDTLSFCLQDGTPLKVLEIPGAPTVVRGREIETFVRQASTGPGASVVTPEASTRRSTFFPMVLAALISGLAVALVAAGIGAWIYFKGDDPANTSAQIGNTSNENSISNGSETTVGNSTPGTPLPATPSPTPAAQPTKIPENTPMPPPVLDREQAVRDISTSIYSWKSQAESHDLDSYMQNYAPTVHYYRKPGSSRAFVRSDKLRAFRTYSTMSIRITNMNVDVSGSGESATALFDKEWVFSGSQRSAGKVRQQLKFQNSGGRWLITSERDLKVYYIN